MQTTEIDFDALDASYIPGTEFCFWASLKERDPFQPHLTQYEITELMGGDDCGANWPIHHISKRIDDYWAADD